jgi:hypothetical protein
MGSVAEIYPFFYLGNSASREDLGFRTVDKVSANCTAPPPAAAIPTLSQWGLILLGLTVLCIGTIQIWKAHQKEVSV